MSSVRGFLLIAIASAVSGLISCGVLQWHDCGNPATRIGTIDRLDINPDPILFGRDVVVGIDFTLLKDIPSDAVLSMEIWRTLNVLGAIPVDLPLPPCTAGGECRMHAYSVFRNWGMACDYIRSNMNGTCDEPARLGKYTGNGYTVHVPELSSLVTAVATGMYKLRFSLTDSKSNELACLYVNEGIYSVTAPPAPSPTQPSRLVKV